MEKALDFKDKHFSFEFGEHGGGNIIWVRFECERNYRAKITNIDSGRMIVHK
jgi:hypothetical protein